MQIREDFTEAAPQLKRLVIYANQARDFNHRDWNHLKNKEDFRQIYQLDSAKRHAYEQIYNVGRDLSVWLSSHLANFNEIGDYPTLKSYVDSFTKSWVTQVTELKSIISKAKAFAEEQGAPWAIDQMVILFEKEVAMLEATQILLEQLKETDLYRLEAGLIKKSTTNNSMSHNITFNSPANVQIGNQNTQTITQTFNAIIEKIDSSAASPAEKEEAKSKLRAFLENPLVASIVGGVVSGIIGLK